MPSFWSTNTISVLLPTCPDKPVVQKASTSQCVDGCVQATHQSFLSSYSRPFQQAVSMASHSGVPRQKWWKIRWFAEDDTPEERKFVTKLDCIIVPYLFVTYWVKNLDQNNLSGLKNSEWDEHVADLLCRQCLCRRHERRAGLLW